MTQEDIQERKLISQYQYDQLDQESDYFSVKMSENLREFGFDGHYTPIGDDKLTDMGKKALSQATAQLNNWLFLDPYQLRRFIQYNCPWTSTDGNYIEQKTEALVRSIWEDQKQLKPLAQIMIRLSEKSRNRYLTVSKIKQLNDKWLMENFGQAPLDHKWDLGMPALNAMMDHTETLLEAVATGALPFWIYVAEALASITKLVALFSIQKERVERTLKTMTAMRKSISLVETMIKNDLARKLKPKSSVSSLDETNSPSLTPTMSTPTKEEKSQNFPINSENLKNIINKQINNIFIYKDMESGNKKDRPELKPEEYLDNFTQLCNRLGLQNQTKQLFILLRECYTNPLCYLGPPKNLSSDLTSLSQPLTVSKESWKSRRIHSLVNRTCARCGQKGHLPANCTQQIRCARCGMEGHATKGCKSEIPKKEAMEEEEKKIPNKSKSQKHQKKGGKKPKSDSK